MPLRLLTAAGCAVALFCIVAPVSAHHQESVSAIAGSLTLEAPRCALYERRPVSRCSGYRRATVTWTATCPFPRPSVTVDYWATRKDGGKPISLASEQVDDQLSGTTTTLVRPGAHMYATVTVDCHWSDPDGTGPEAHSATATSTPTGEVIVPPWLREVSIQKGNYCNFDPGSRTVLQARQRGSIVSFGSDFVDKSLLGSGRRTPAAVRQRRLGASGAGISVRQRPEVFLLVDFGRREPFSGLLRVNPRKAGWLKVWEEVGGVRSNTLAIKVVPNRC